MLRRMKDLHGFTTGATDGDIGHLEDFLVDDHSWSQARGAAPGGRRPCLGHGRLRGRLGHLSSEAWDRRNHHGRATGHDRSHEATAFHGCLPRVHHRSDAKARLCHTGQS
jgi:hypothetical protein